MEAVATLQNRDQAYYRIEISDRERLMKAEYDDKVVHRVVWNNACDCGRDLQRSQVAVVKNLGGRTHRHRSIILPSSAPISPVIIIGETLILMGVSKGD